MKNYLKLKIFVLYTNSAILSDEASERNSLKSYCAVHHYDDFMDVNRWAEIIVRVRY